MKSSIQGRAVRYGLAESPPLVFLIVLAGAVRLLWRAHCMGGPGLDGAQYVDLAVGFSRGDGYDALNDWIGHFVAPLYPVLVALVSWLPVDAISTPLGAARAVSVAAGSILVGPIWLVTRR